VSQQGAGRLAPLLRESLALWGVAAVVRISVERGAAQPEAVPGERVWIEGEGVPRLSIVAAAHGDGPFRWWLCWHAGDAAGPADAAAAVVRRKPCAAVLGLLRTLRETLGVAAGRRVRIGLGAMPTA
jgi:hypothetical protein